MKRSGSRLAGRIGLAAVAAGAVLATAGVASADQIGPITFEPPFTPGSINGQQGWMKTGMPYDAEVASVASFPDAAGYGFGTQALRISNSFTSGSFGDQTFSPGLTQPAGEGPPASVPATNRHFEASFRIGTTKATQQPDLRVTVSPDDGQGSRMSFLRFEDQPDGVHVIFADVVDPGPLGTVADFVLTDIATITPGEAHKVVFALDLSPGPANDVVRIFVDGKLRRAHTAHERCHEADSHGKGPKEKCVSHPGRKATGTTWEDYYRYDPEQNGNGHVVPKVSHLLFRVSGDPAPANAGQGVLIDRVKLVASNVPERRRDCKRGGWTTRTRANGTSFANQGACVRYVKRHGHHH